jgi:hypothetical protein
MIHHIHLPRLFLYSNASSLLERIKVEAFPRLTERISRCDGYPTVAHRFLSIAGLFHAIMWAGGPAMPSPGEPQAEPTIAKAQRQTRGPCSYRSQAAR